MARVGLKVRIIVSKVMGGAVQSSKSGLLGPHVKVVQGFQRREMNWILEYSTERLGGETKGEVGSVRLWAQQAYVFVSLLPEHVGPLALCLENC